MSKHLLSFLLATILLGGGLFYGVWEFQHNLIGEPPKTQFSAVQHSQQFDYQDPDIIRLRNATKVRPKERAVWMSLARELLVKSQKGILDPQKATLEAVAAIREVLNLDEKDTEALLLMADTSFEMQAFPKALEFYGKYLDITPEDDATRARYASTLIFLGRADEAREILDGVLQRDPEAFQARAFLALAYAQLGDSEKVEEQGRKALELAPSEEARTRLSQFLASFKGKSSASAAVTATDDTEEGRLFQHLVNNPVAGNKMKRFRLEDEVFYVQVEQFPMSAMPPFAKTKFFEGIRSFAKEQEFKTIKKIVFQDVVSGKIEGEMELASE